MTAPGILFKGVFFKNIFVYHGGWLNFIDVFFLMKKPVAETHFVVGTSDIVGSQFKFVGLHDVLLRNGLNFIAAYVGSCWADVGPLLG